MNFIIPTSITSIVIACLLFLFAVIQIAIDAIDIRRSRRLYKTLIAVAKSQNKQSFTVVVELTRQATTLLPLLDHLYQHNYSKLEVIVVIKHSAGKNARTVLERYRRANRIKGLKLVKHVRGLSNSDILRRYGSGSLAMMLGSDERLSIDFFSVASIESLRKKNNVIVLARRHLQINNTITSALQAHFGILRQTAMRILGRKTIVKPLTSGVVYKRRALTTGDTAKEIVKLIPNQQLYVASSAEVQKISHYFTQSLKNAKSLSGIIAGTSIVVTTFLLAFLFNRYEQFLLLTTLVVVYVLISLSMQMRTKGYSLIDRINLALTSPLGLMFTVIVSLCALLIRLFGVMRFSGNNQFKLLRRLTPLKR